MFATPVTAPLHETLANHVFGRFMPQRAQPVVTEAVTALAQVQAPAVVVGEDAFPDLAQRVRDVGEW
ncbi:MAG: hypothetical protein ACK4OE_19135 [Acidovorax sp.]|uniref:hypothetical protein n=1 Tax=Acidovorax sp. TaxID=1872122 RepID=UPI00391C1308